MGTTPWNKQGKRYSRLYNSRTRIDKPSIGEISEVTMSLKNKESGSDILTVELLKNGGPLWEGLHELTLLNVTYKVLLAGIYKRINVYLGPTTPQKIKYMLCNKYWKGA